jgi:hypothetical protein
MPADKFPEYQQHRHLQSGTSLSLSKEIPYARDTDYSPLFRRLSLAAGHPHRVRWTLTASTVLPSCFARSSSGIVPSSASSSAVQAG